MLYFSDLSVFSVLLSGIFLGFFCYVFLRLSSIYGSVFNAFGHLKPIVKFLIVAADFVVLCAGIAGSDGVFYELFNLHIGSIIITLLSVTIILFGYRSIRYVNFFVVPIIIALVSVVFFSDLSFPYYGKNSVVSPFLYASMNLLTGGFFIGENADNPTKKECLLTSVISGITLTCLLVAVFLSSRGVFGEMPFLEKAYSLGFGTIGNIVLLLALLTTVIGTLSVCSANKKTSVLFLASVSLFLSSFGFGTIVDTIYPIIGVIGSVVTVCTLFIFILSVTPKFSRYYNRLFRPTDFSIFQRRKRAR